MSRSAQPGRGPIVAACAVVFLIGRVTSGGQEAIPRPTAGQAKVRKALDKKTEFDFVERPLAEVAEAIGERHQIEVQLDRARLADEGVEVEEPVITCRAKGVTLRTGLRLLLRDLDMTYVVRDGYLLLTTESVGLDTAITRRIRGVPLSSLLHLLLDELDLTFLVFHGEALLITAKVECEALLFAKVYPVFDLVCRAGGENDEGAGLDYESLIDGVTTCVAPTTWDEVGGPGEIKVFAASGALVIGQTTAIHEDIAQYLQALRDVAAE